MTDFVKEQQTKGSFVNEVVVIGNKSRVSSPIHINLPT